MLAQPSHAAADAADAAFHVAPGDPSTPEKLFHRWLRQKKQHSDAEEHGLDGCGLLQREGGCRSDEGGGNTDVLICKAATFYALTDDAPDGSLQP